MSARALTLAAVATMAGGCTLLRPVQVPPPPAPAAFVSGAEALHPAATGAAAAPAPVEPVTRRAVWWSAFADPALDAAVQEALRNNYFLKDVRTLIEENRLDPTTPRGFLWPLQVGIPATTPATAARITGAAAGNQPIAVAYNQANVDLTASYQLDLSGNLDARRRVADDLVEQQRQSTELASQNTAEQVGQLWFDILVERALKDLTLREVKYNEELLALVKARFDQHLANRLVVLQQEQQLLNSQAQVPLVNARIAQLNSQLTALLGRLPSPRDELVPADRALPDLPPSPSLGTPADLFENTAEMRFARLRVTEIENRVNQNLSSWLPSIELVGSAGVVGFTPSLTFPESVAAVRLSWPVFDGGRRITEAQQLNLTLKRRKWQYELAIKSAVGRVQDALLQEQNQAESLRSLRAQIELGGHLLQEARRLFEQGQSDYLPVLTALSNLASLERSGLRAQRLLLSYRIQLYRALGGTWSYDVTILPD